MAAASETFAGDGSRRSATEPRRERVDAGAGSAGGGKGNPVSVRPSARMAKTPTERPMATLHRPPAPAQRAWRGPRPDWPGSRARPRPREPHVADRRARAALELLDQPPLDLCEPALGRSAGVVLSVVGNAGRVGEPDLQPECERLHLDLEIALGARTGAAESVEASHDERRVARFVEVLPKGRLDDGARRDAGRRAVGSELLGEGGVEVGLEPDSLVSADFAGARTWRRRREKKTRTRLTRLDQSVSATGEIEECKRLLPAGSCPRALGLMSAWRPSSSGSWASEMVVELTR